MFDKRLWFCFAVAERIKVSELDEVVNEWPKITVKIRCILNLTFICAFLLAVSLSPANRSDLQQS